MGGLFEVCYFSIVILLTLMGFVAAITALAMLLFYIPVELIALNLTHAMFYLFVFLISLFVALSVFHLWIPEVQIPFISRIWR